MDVAIFEKSVDYLERYRLLALMQAIVDTDPDHTKLEDRDIDYFVAGYISRFAFTDKPAYSRYLYDSLDSDVDSDGNTTTRRHPRHLPRAEVKGLFAAHAEWILADQLAKRDDKRVVGFAHWHTFCRDVKHARREAAVNGMRWGRPTGAGADMDDSDGSVDLSNFGVVGKDINKLLRAAKTKKRAKKKVKQFVLYDLSHSCLFRQEHAPHPFQLQRARCLVKTRWCRLRMFTTPISHRRQHLPGQTHPRRWMP